MPDLLSLTDYPEQSAYRHPDVAHDLTQRAKEVRDAANKLYQAAEGIEWCQWAEQQEHLNPAYIRKRFEDCAMELPGAIESLLITIEDRDLLPRLRDAADNLYVKVKPDERKLTDGSA